MRTLSLVRLGDICRPKQWTTLSKKEMVSDGFPVYGANGKIGFASKFTHTKPTLLIGCRGSCGSVHIMEPFSYANGNAMALDNLNEDLVDIKYIYHYFLHRGFADVITGSSQPQIIQQHLRKIEIPLPTLEEQRRIAAILDKAEEINLNRIKSIRSIKALQEALFNEPSRQNTYPSANLINYRLSDLLEIPLRNGISPSKGGHIEFQVLTLSAITRGKFIPSHKKKGTFKSQPAAGKKVDAHDFLICRGNGNIDLVGLGEFPETTDEFTVFPDTIIAARLKRDLVDPFYFSLAWKQPSIRHQITAKSRTTNGTFKINQASLESIAISLPPLKQQRIFASKAKPLRIMLREKENNVDSYLAELKKTLLNNLLQE